MPRVQFDPNMAKGSCSVAFRSETALRLLHLREDFLQAQGGGETEGE